MLEVLVELGVRPPPSLPSTGSHSVSPLPRLTAMPSQGFTPTGTLLDTLGQHHLLRHGADPPSSPSPPTSLASFASEQVGG